MAVFNGSGIDEEIFGTEFSDTINGFGGFNRLHGLAGDDVITGGGDEDWIWGGLGTDTLDGGGGDNDVLFYTDQPAGTTINLATGISINGEGNFETTINFEAAHGSEYGDFITLATNTGYVFGRGGDDVFYGTNAGHNFIGGSGNDTINGGTGIDIADYFDDGFDAAGAATLGVFVDLQNEYAVDGWGDTDTLIDVENVNGSSLGDTLIGSDEINFLSGGDGSDFIQGLAGQDYLQGGEGNDILNGGSGFDTLEGGVGGYDTADYSDDGFDSAGPITQGVVVDLGAGTATDSWGDADTLIDIEAVQGSHLNDTITGSVGQNSLFGGDGADIIHNGGTSTMSQFDYVDGGNGDDTLTVLGGGLINGGQGNDTIRGETVGDPNIDYVIVSYSSSPGAIVANLTATANGGLAGGDMTNGFLVNDGFGTQDNIANVNNITGTASSDLIYVDSTFMNSYGNWIEVRPDGGDDQVFFNAVDTARISYSNLNSGVLADLEAGTATDLVSGANVIGNDTFVGANQFRGSRAADDISGLSGDDARLRGHDGDDTINGLGGNDLIEGENGNDRLIGGTGDDIIKGGADIDTAVFSSAIANYDFRQVIGSDELEVIGGGDVDVVFNDVEILEFAGLSWDYSALDVTIHDGAGNSLDWHFGWNLGWYNNGWQKGWNYGLNIGWTTGWYFGWNNGWYLSASGWTVGWNVGWTTGWHIGWSVGWTYGWFNAGWQNGWNVSWYYGWGVEGT